MSKKLTRREAAAYLGIKTPTLAKWACIGEPFITYYLVGGRAIYDIDDLDEFLARCKVNPVLED